MARYSTTLRDQDLAPIDGAYVSVTDTWTNTAAVLTDDDDQPLDNPFVTGEYGEVTFNTAAGSYTVSYNYGGRTVLTEVTPVGTLILNVQPAPDHAGEYIALDADGNATYASGTGADAGLRTDLAATTGAALVGTTGGVSVQSRFNTLASSAGSSAVGFLQAGTGAVARTTQSKMREYVSVLDFGAVGDADRSGNGTDDTAAIQAALNASNNVYFPGSRAGRLYKFTNLTLPLRTRIGGDGPRASVLRQAPTATGAAITFETGKAPLPGGYGVDDITEGAQSFEDIGIEVASDIGILIGPNAYASMITTNNLRLINQFCETLGAPPYAVPAGTIGISMDGGFNPDGSPGPNAAPVYMGFHKNLEIRSFETGIMAMGAVNEWHVHGWIINCEKAFDLNLVSTWMIEVACETGVEDARMFYLDGPVGNLIIDGGRAEMTASGSYMFEFGASIDADNIRIRDTNINILSDGGTWPGRKYTGTLPQDVTFDLSRASNPLIAASLTTDFTYSVGNVRLGGTALGDGSLIIGRNVGGGDFKFYNSADGNGRIIAGNDLNLSGGGSTSAKLIVNNTGIGVNGTAPIAKPTVTGSKGANAALTSLLTALAAYGLITDSSS